MPPPQNTHATSRGAPQGTDNEMLAELQRETFDYFILEVNKKTGLIADRTQPGSPSSIAGVGLGLTAYVVGAEREFISREEAAKRVLGILQYFKASRQGPEKDVTGYKGFYYHFLDMETGKRAGNCELSTIDTALFIAGALAAAEYFLEVNEQETQIREIADFLYRRIDWQWALNGEKTLTHGWVPESGFFPYRWSQNYSEALILYVLAMGSPTFPIEKEGYRLWTSTFELTEHYGTKYLYAGPLFIHQMSQIWLDLRSLHDDFNRKVGFDYFENSRRATFVQREYAIANPRKFEHYGENCWGITASDGPGPAEIEVNGIKRTFYDYIARGAPNDLDDGTISPWAVVTSLPFAPEIVLTAIRHAIEKLQLKGRKRMYGFDASFNPTFPEKSRNVHGWVSEWRFAINQGPIIMMIENFNSGLIWKLMRKSRVIQEGLAQAGFREK